jgi:hypothetical protein
VNVAHVEFVGFAGEDVIVGVGGPLVARAVHARTPSSARGIDALVLFAVVVRRLIMVARTFRVWGGRVVVRVSTALGARVSGPPAEVACWC